MTLRQVLAAFLPTGGILDRLGDSREKAREKARETLVILGGLAFRAGGVSSMSKAKGIETPLMTFEKYFREGGLGSKVWRVREQVILYLYLHSACLSNIRLLRTIVYPNPRPHTPGTPPLSDTSLPPTASCGTRRHRWKCP